MAKPGFWQPDRRLQASLGFLLHIALIAAVFALSWAGIPLGAMFVYVLFVFLRSSASMADRISAARPMWRRIRSRDEAVTEASRAAAAGWYPRDFYPFLRIVRIGELVFLFAIFGFAVFDFLGGPWIWLPLGTAAVLVLILSYIVMKWFRLSSNDWRIGSGLLPALLKNREFEDGFLYLSPSSEIEEILQISQVLEEESVVVDVRKMEPQDVEFEEFLRALCASINSSRDFRIHTVRWAFEESGHPANFHDQLYYLWDQGRLRLLSDSWPHHGVVYSDLGRRSRIFHVMRWRVLEDGHLTGREE